MATTLKTKNDFEKLAKSIENKTGYEIYIKVIKTGSMLGYVELGIKEQYNGSYAWRFGVAKELLSVYIKPKNDPNPTLSGLNIFSYYIGKEVLNW